jgi:hypothetical protein
MQQGILENPTQNPFPCKDNQKVAAMQDDLIIWASSLISDVQWSSALISGYTTL